MHSIIEIVFYFWKNFVQVSLIMTLIYSITNFFFEKQYKTLNFRVYSFLLIISFIHFLISIIFNFIMYDGYIFLFKNIFLNFIVTFFIYIGWSKHNYQNINKKKHIRIFVFYLIGLSLMFLNI